VSRLRLSVLDQSPVSAASSPAQAIQDSVRLASILDNQGFTRYWFAEHHHSAGFAGSAPEILIAAALERTRQLRIGSGGVLLPRYPVAKVAEVFTVLAALHGPRLDLGLGRAGDSGADYPQQLLDLHGELDAQAAQGGLRPMVWLLGAGTGSSTLAAQLGTSFAYGHFLNPAFARQALLHYRCRFSASAHQRQPSSVIAVRAVVAQSSARAAQLADSFLLWRSRKDLGVDAPFPTVAQTRRHSWTPAESRRRTANVGSVFFGSAAEVRAELLALVDGLGVDEIMVNTPLAGLQDRVDSYLALAEAFQQQPALRAGHDPQVTDRAS